MLYVPIHDVTLVPRYMFIAHGNVPPPFLHNSPVTVACPGDCQTYSGCQYSMRCVCMSICTPFCYNNLQVRIHPAVTPLPGAIVGSWGAVWF